LPSQFEEVKETICEHPRLVCSFDIVSRLQSLCLSVICQQHLHPAFSAKTQVLNDPTAHIFKKQRLRFNPPRSLVPNFDNFDSIPVIEEAMNDDYLSSPSNDDSLLSDEEPLVDDNVSYNVFEQFHVAEASFTNEAPCASGYSSFTTSQKCVTSLILLLDSLA
jgi:hypothetical protein